MEVREMRAKRIPEPIRFDSESGTGKSPNPSPNRGKWVGTGFSPIYRETRTPYLHPGPMGEREKRDSEHAGIWLARAFGLESLNSDGEINGHRPQSRCHSQHRASGSRSVRHGERRGIQAHKRVAPLIAWSLLLLHGYGLIAPQSLLDPAISQRCWEKEASFEPTYHFSQIRQAQIQPQPNDKERLTMKDKEPKREPERTICRRMVDAAAHAAVDLSTQFGYHAAERLAPNVIRPVVHAGITVDAQGATLRLRFDGRDNEAPSFDAFCDAMEGADWFRFERKGRNREEALYAVGVRPESLRDLLGTVHESPRDRLRLTDLAGGWR